MRRLGGAAGLAVLALAGCGSGQPYADPSALADKLKCSSTFAAGPPVDGAARGTCTYGGQPVELLVGRDMRQRDTAVASLRGAPGSSQAVLGSSGGWAVLAGSIEVANAVQDRLGGAVHPPA